MSRVAMVYQEAMAASRARKTMKRMMRIRACKLRFNRVQLDRDTKSTLQRGVGRGLLLLGVGGQEREKGKSLDVFRISL